MRDSGNYSRQKMLVIGAELHKREADDQVIQDHLGTRATVATERQAGTVERAYTLSRWALAIAILALIVAA